MGKQLKVAVIGCGARGMNAYAPYVAECSEAEIVAGADLIEERRNEFMERYHIQPELCFESAEEFFEKPKMADAVFICTQDHQHYDHAMTAMHLGYDILLEKPITITAKQCIEIAQEANRLGCKVAVCHVLRYSPFYLRLREMIRSGAIGDVMSLHQFENVGWGHYAHSFTRGNWRNSEESAPMILAKCCHDFDIILWLIGKDCLRVSSFGSLSHFRKENAPTDEERCLATCPRFDTCPYNAQRLYRDSIWKGFKMTFTFDDDSEDVLAEKLASTGYGRCVYHCDNNVVDHQITNMEFEDGVTASLTMCAFTRDMNREIKIMGTYGELVGDLDKGLIYWTRFGAETQVIDVKENADENLGAHGGGDTNLVGDFLAMLGETTGERECLTSIDKSIQSHIIAFAAERSRVEHGRVVGLKEIYGEQEH